MMAVVFVSLWFLFHYAMIFVTFQALGCIFNGVGFLTNSLDIGTLQKKEYFLCAETPGAAKAWVSTLR